MDDIRKFGNPLKTFLSPVNWMGQQSKSVGHQALSTTKVEQKNLLLLELTPSFLNPLFPWVDSGVRETCWNEFKWKSWRMYFDQLQGVLELKKSLISVTWSRVVSNKEHGFIPDGNISCHSTLPNASYFRTSLAPGQANYCPVAWSQRDAGNVFTE